MFNVDPVKVTSVVNGSLPPNTKVGWRKSEDGKFSAIFVAFKRSGEPIVARDGAVMLNEREAR